MTNIKNENLKTIHTSKEPEYKEKAKVQMKKNPEGDEIKLRYNYVA